MRADDLERVILSCRTIIERAQALLDESGGGDASDARKAARHLELALQYLEPGRPGTSPAALPRTLQGSVSQVVGHQMKSLVSPRSDAPSPARPGPQSASRGLEGDTQTVSLVDLISLLALQEMSGVLRIQGRQECFTLFFERGALIDAVSTATPPGYRLGEILVRQGALTQEQLDEFLQRYASSRERLGAALEHEEAITKADLSKALEFQVQHLFNRMTRTKEATFVFREGLPADMDTQLRLNVQGLVLESARVHDERMAELNG